MFDSHKVSFWYSSPCFQTGCNLIASAFVTPVELLRCLEMCCGGNSSKWMFMIHVTYIVSFLNGLVSVNKKNHSSDGQRQ